MQANVIKLIFALGLLIIIGNSTAKSNTYNVEIKSFENIDLCKEKLDNTITIAPEMGLVLKRDSLIGFEFMIKYDPNIVQLNEKYTINTMSSYFKYVSVEFDSERGEVVVDCLQDFFKPVPVQSDLPLIALGGTFKGDCKDSAVFEMVYFAPTSDFVGTIDSLKSLTIAGQIADKPGRVQTYNVLSNNNNIIKDSTIVVDVKLDLGIAESIDLIKTKIQFDKDSLYIADIIGNESIEVLEFNKIDNFNYEVDFKVINNLNETFNLVLTTDKFDTTETNISLITIDYSECACINDVEIESFTVYTLQSKKDTLINSVVPWEKEFQIFGNKLIPLRNKTQIEVYDVNGRKIEQTECNINQVYSTESLDRGIYFIKVTNRNVRQIIKIINN